MCSREKIYISRLNKVIKLDHDFLENIPRNELNCHWPLQGFFWVVVEMVKLWKTEGDLVRSGNSKENIQK